MTHEFDLVQELTAGIEERNGAWQFIRRFAQNWVVPLEDEDGWSEADLTSAEERLGVPLPAAMREAYQLFDRRKDLTSNHDVLLSPQNSTWMTARRLWSSGMRTRAPPPGAS